MTTSTNAHGISNAMMNLLVRISETRNKPLSVLIQEHLEQIAIVALENQKRRWLLINQEEVDQQEYNMHNEETNDWVNHGGS